GFAAKWSEWEIGRQQARGHGLGLAFFFPGDPEPARTAYFKRNGRPLLRPARRDADCLLHRGGHSLVAGHAVSVTLSRSPRAGGRDRSGPVRGSDWLWRRAARWPRDGLDQ